MKISKLCIQHVHSEKFIIREQRITKGKHEIMKLLVIIEMRAEDHKTLLIPTTVMKALLILNKHI